MLARTPSDITFFEEEAEALTPEHPARCVSIQTCVENPCKGQATPHVTPNLFDRDVNIEATYLDEPDEEVENEYEDDFIMGLGQEASGKITALEAIAHLSGMGTGVALFLCAKDKYLKALAVAGTLLLGGTLIQKLRK